MSREREIDWKALGVEDAVGDLTHFDALLGLDFDPKLLINTAAELAKGGVDIHANKEAAKLTAAEEKKQTEAGIAADQALATALANLYGAQEKKVDAAALAGFQTIVEVRRPAASAIPSTPGRANACQAEVQKAADALAKAPHDATLTVKLRAWREVCAGSALSATPTAQVPATLSLPSDEGPSFLTRKFWGVPTWGWGVGGIVVATGAALLVQAFSGRRG